MNQENREIKVMSEEEKKELKRQEKLKQEMLDCPFCNSHTGPNL